MKELDLADHSVLLNKNGQAIFIMSLLKKEQEGSYKIDSFIQAFIENQVWEDEKAYGIAPNRAWTTNFHDAVYLVQVLNPGWEMDSIKWIKELACPSLRLKTDHTVKIESKKISLNPALSICSLNFQVLISHFERQIRALKG